MRGEVVANAMPNPAAWQILQKRHQLSLISATYFEIHDAFIAEAEPGVELSAFMEAAQQHDMAICGPVYVGEKKSYALAIPLAAVEAGLNIWEWNTKDLAEVTHEQQREGKTGSSDEGA